MRTIKRPADVAITNQGRPVLKPDKEPFTLSLHDFLTAVLESEPRCSQTFEAARRAHRIDAAAIGDDAEIKVHDEDLAWFLDILKTAALPTLPLADGSRLSLGRQLLPFLDAFEASEPVMPAAPGAAPASPPALPPAAPVPAPQPHTVVP